MSRKRKIKTEAEINFENLQKYIAPNTMEEYVSSCRKSLQNFFGESKIQFTRLVYDGLGTETTATCTVKHKHKKTDPIATIVWSNDGQTLTINDTQIPYSFGRMVNLMNELGKLLDKLNL